jgi:hypothetical protein
MNSYPLRQGDALALTLPVACIGSTHKVLTETIKMSLAAFIAGNCHTFDAPNEITESLSWEPGDTQRIDKETYDERFELLPPRWHDASAFAFGEGSGNFSIFWTEEHEYFVRHLDEAKTAEFCDLAGIRLHQ